MSFYILEILRQQAWKALWNIPKTFLFRAQVDADVKRVIVGSKGTKKIVPVVDSDAENPETTYWGGDERDQKRDHVLGVLYLGAVELRDAWEFKDIAVDGQTLPAILFNLRRLFPQNAEDYIPRHHHSGNAIAIALEIEPGNAMHQLLRLAFYVDGDRSVNYTMDERADVMEEKSLLRNQEEQETDD